jgi:hypothetical protein
VSFHPRFHTHDQRLPIDDLETVAGGVRTAFDAVRHAALVGAHAWVVTLAAVVRQAKAAVHAAPSVACDMLASWRHETDLVFSGIASLRLLDSIFRPHG